jgi:hypothetical protein
VTTHGDPVGPSAKSAVVPPPTPETDADLPVTEPTPDGADEAGARGTAPSVRPSGPDAAKIIDGTATPADARPDDTAATDTPAAADSPAAEPPNATPEPEPAPEPESEPPAEPAPDPTAEQEASAETEPTPAATPTIKVRPKARRASKAQPHPTPDVAPEAAPAADSTTESAAEPGDSPAAAPTHDQDKIADRGGFAAGDTDMKETVLTTPGPAGQSEPAEAEPADEARLSDQAELAEEAGPADQAELADQAKPAEEAAVLGAVALPAATPAVAALAAALTGLRSAIGGAAYPLVMPSADDARRVGAALVSQLDDYLLPRLARLDAPLLVVIGGSTGAGKSTLVNSLVRERVSAAGVLRPTTRSPVLVCHPTDASWFRGGDLLPGLTRTSEASSDPKALQLVTVTALGPGLAFLDAPDIDSVVDANRALAAQLLAAADLWLFVTTAARYADAVPWELLRTARLRGTVTALVLDRVPAEAAGEISAHLGEMLRAHELGAAPLFVLPETELDDGLLPEDVAKPLHDWFAQLAADSSARAAVVRQTLDGALAALGPAVDGLAGAADDQALAARALDERVRAAYRNSRRTVEQGLQDGRLLRGEVLARWQEFIGTGEFLRGLESRVGHLRDRVVAAVTGRPAPGRNLQVALESQIITLLRGVAADAAEGAYTGWQAHPAGAALLTPELARASDDLPERAERLVREWQRAVLELVRTEAGDKRFVARSAAYAVNATGLAVMIAVFTSTAFIPTGAEIAVGAGTTVAAQKVLEAIFGDQAIRTLAARARDDLLTRVDALLDTEAARYAARTESVGLDVEPGGALRKAAETVEAAREELALTAEAELLLVDPS